MTRNHLYSITVSVRAPDEPTAWRRWRQAASLETAEELARRGVLVEEIVGFLYPDELAAEHLTEAQVAERISMRDRSSKASWRRWVSKMRAGRRVRRRLGAVA